MSRVDLIKTRLDQKVSDGNLYYGGISGSVNGETYTYTSGYADLAKTKPFTETTLIRQMSDTKLMGTVAFLKLVEDGILTGHEPLSAFIPEFENTKVISPIIPNKEKYTSMTLKNRASITLLSSGKSSIKNGDTIMAYTPVDINGIPKSEINGTHTVSSNIFGQLKFNTNTKATSYGDGTSVEIYKVPDSESIDVDGETYYYNLVDLEYPVTIWHLLTQTIGYMYNQLSLGNPFGYAETNPTKTAYAAREIQIQLLADAKIPAASPDKNLPLSYGDVMEWSSALAEIPMLFQPGEHWAYGPGLGLLGAVCQSVSGLSADDYFKQALTQPLGMNDTGFFTDDDNFADLLVHTPTGWVDITTIIPTFHPDYNYGTDAPKTLVLYDGGSYSTLKDRNIFYNMLRNNGKMEDGTYFMSPALISLISTNNIGNLPTLKVSPPKIMPKWGLGSAVGAGANAVFTMSGQTKRNVYWNGAFNTSFSVDFGNDAYVNFVSNMMSFVDVAMDNVACLFNIHMSAIEDIKINTSNV